MTRMELDLPINPLLLLDGHSSSQNRNDEDEDGAGDESQIARRRAKPQRVLTIQRKEILRYREEHLQQVEETVPVATFRRKTTLFGFLLVICQLAVVDDYHLLPIGIFLYAVGIGLAMEWLQDPPEEVTVMMVTPWEELARQRRHQQRQPNCRQDEISFRQEEFRRVQEMVNFQFNVLQGKQNVRVIAVEQENGQVTYFTE